MYIIPLTTAPNQSFRCVIPVNGKALPLRFFLTYNTQAEYWIMRVSNDRNEPLIDSLPIYRGRYPAANLLQQHHHLRIGSATLVPIGEAPAEQQPDSSTLGTQFALVWGDNLDE